MKLEAAFRYAIGKRKGPLIPGGITPEIRSWIDELGKEYKPANLPDDIERGPAGYCFDACTMNLLISNKYQYVEGMAFSGEGWYYHAWLTDGVHAYDPTWQIIGKGGMEHPLNPLRYIGFVIPTGFLMFFNFKTQQAGVLGNRARYPQAVDKMLDSIREQRQE